MAAACDRAGVPPTQEIPSTTGKEAALDVCVQWGGVSSGQWPGDRN
ncbi:MAG: hypothetical protein HC890_12225 [Chloroflexaceae bacterium]|nr:hypothetical protein [Chloroflexaceae bacterium]